MSRSCPACRGKYTKSQMIQCSLCNFWVHFRCVGILSEEGATERAPTFVCPPCYTRSVEDDYLSSSSSSSYHGDLQDSNHAATFNNAQIQFNGTSSHGNHRIESESNVNVAQNTNSVQLVTNASAIERNSQRAADCHTSNTFAPPPRGRRRSSRLASSEMRNVNVRLSNVDNSSSSFQPHQNAVSYPSLKSYRHTKTEPLSQFDGSRPED